MKTENNTKEHQEPTAREFDWERARMTTQAVAFRVIGVNDDSVSGRVPIWGPSPLTAEEEAVLARLTDSH
jgi:hypothetical protein